MKKIFMSEPNLKGNEKKYLINCIKSNFVSSHGVYLEKFENKIKQEQDKFNEEKDKLNKVNESLSLKSKEENKKIVDNIINEKNTLMKTLKDKEKN